MLETKDKFLICGVALVLAGMGARFAVETRKELTSEKVSHSETIKKLETSNAALSTAKVQIALLSSSLREIESKLKTSQQGRHTETHGADGSSSITDEWNNQLESSQREIENLQMSLNSEKEQTLRMNIEMVSTNLEKKKLTEKIHTLETTKPTFRHWQIQGGMYSGEIDYYIPLGILDLGAGVLNQWNSIAPEWRVGLRF